MSDTDDSDNEISDTEVLAEADHEYIDILNEKSLIYNNLTEKEFRNESVTLLTTYIKHKSNIKMVEDEIYKNSLVLNKLNKELYLNIITSVILSINNIGLKQAFEDLSNNTSKYGWDNLIFNEISQFEDKEVSKILRPVKIMEGIYTCFKCGGKHTHSYEIQMRSSDEPATVFIECVNPKCRNKWKIG